MKAARIHKYGPAEEIRIEDAPVPEIQPDEVLIKVSATSFNPLDVLLRSGAYHAVMPLQFPFTLSSDVSGIVEKTGAGVQNLKTGDRVYGMLGFTQNGAAAEYVVAKANVLAKAPATTDLEKAGGVPLVALTAWQGIVEHAKVKKGQRVFINAASGAVGAYAVQFSKQAGAYVIGSASPRNFDLLKQCGANEAIDYHVDSFENNITTKVDVVFNLAPLPAEKVNALLDLLNEGGVLVSALTPADPEIAASKKVTAARMIVHQDAKQLEEIAARIDRKELRVYISETVGLGDIVKVHEKYEAGKIAGKVVIKVS